MADSTTRTEAVLMGRPPKEPTEVVGLRLPVSLVEDCDRELRIDLKKWRDLGIDNRTALLKRFIIEGLDRARKSRTR